MEGLKFYWAKNIATLPADVKQNGLVRGFVNTTSASGKPVLYSFEELLTAAANALGVTTTFTFIEDRNALFHTGATSAAQLGATGTWAALKPEMIRLYDQMDDLLLHLLNYSGPIHPWQGPHPKVLFPARTPIQ